MPKSVKISREMILDAVVELVNESGAEFTTAATITERLKCSVQPIYYVFGSMDNLWDTVFERVLDFYNENIRKEIPGTTKAKAVGINYIKFVRKYPNLYKLLFFNSRPKNIKLLQSGYEKDKEYIIGLLKEEHGIDEKRVEKVYFDMSVYYNGIAAMITAKTAKFKNEDIERTVDGMFKIFMAELPE